MSARGVYLRDSLHANPQSNRIRWTHFLSIPLRSAEDQAAFRKLKEAIFRRAPRIVPDKAFGSEAKFHITLCMLRLKGGGADLERAREVLRTCMPTVRTILHEAGCIEEGKVVIPFEPGLAMFVDQSVDDDKTRLLFRDVARGSRARSALERIAALFTQSFQDAGLTTSLLSTVLPLHATVVYVRYAVNSKRPFKPIDGRRVLKALAEWPASTSSTPDLHLSVLGKTAPDGYFHCAMRVLVVAAEGAT
jgi:hypothetical protein